MPYSGSNDPKLPNYVQELDESKRKQWVAVFNDVYAKTGDEGRAIASASAAVKSVNPETEAEEKAWLETLENLAPEKVSILERFAKWFLGTPRKDYGFKVVGENQWIAWYTNAYQDKDYEFFPELAIQRDIDYMNSQADYPELWFYHIPGTGHGVGKWAGTWAGALTDVRCQIGANTSAGGQYLHGYPSFLMLSSAEASAAQMLAGATAA